VSNEQKFQRVLDRWGVKHFAAKEFFYRGASDEKLNLNTDPPAALWPNMERTAKVLDEARKRLGASIRITSAYRSPAYNKRIGGVSNSTHVRFNATDLVTDSPAKLYLVLLDLRREGLFKGGLGLYRSFVHLDTRGTNATWRG
jgi:lysozyme